ncbi:MAG: hypothetical protein QOF36_657, partial [Microbacteriaceae bacterium]|nr:hypothetical protein [Microbacteriaceae bacterium]
MSDGREGERGGDEPDKSDGRSADASTDATPAVGSPEWLLAQLRGGRVSDAAPGPVPPPAPVPPPTPVAPPVVPDAPANEPFVAPVAPPKSTWPFAPPPASEPVAPTFEPVAPTFEPLPPAFEPVAPALAPAEPSVASADPADPAESDGFDLFDWAASPDAVGDASDTPLAEGAETP